MIVKLLFSTVAALGLAVTAYAGTPLTEVEDNQVSSALIEDLKVAQSADHRVGARAVAVHVGTAYNIDKVMLTLVDTGPTEGDYPNTSTFDLGSGFVGRDLEIIKDLAIAKVKENVYRLSFRGRLVTWEDPNGEPSYKPTKVQLIIKLANDGSLVSVEKN
jgi:hypothetical protein